MRPIRVRKIDDLWVIFQNGRRCASSSDWDTIRTLAGRMGDRLDKAARLNRWLYQPAR